MSARRTYAITIRWQHRNFGPQSVGLEAEGTSIRRAISNALLGFFSDTKPGPKARRDAHAQITVGARRLPATKAADR